MEKKIRFGDLVRNSGRPQSVTLWGEPKKMPSFRKAIKENRVLTLIQSSGTKAKDFGLIGFREQPHASYLIFPRKLPTEGEARVIGINYQLIKEPAVAHPIRTKEIKPPKVAKDVPAKRPLPEKKRFNVRVRRTATLDCEFAVEALDRTEAELQALKQAKDTPFKVDKGGVREEIVKVE